MSNLNIAQLPVLSGVTSDDARFIVQQGSGTFQVTGAQLRSAYGGASGGSGGVQSVQPGTGIAVDNTDPANPIVSATGGGGGGGPQQLQGVLKTGGNNTITDTDFTTASNTPLIGTNLTAITIDLGNLNGTYVGYFYTVAAAGTTLTSAGGAKIIDKSTAAVSSISLAQSETIIAAFTGDGTGNWSIQVLNRY